MLCVPFDGKLIQLGGYVKPNGEIIYCENDRYFHNNIAKMYCFGEFYDSLVETRRDLQRLKFKDKEKFKEEREKLTKQGLIKDGEFNIYASSKLNDEELKALKAWKKSTNYSDFFKLSDFMVEVLGWDSVHVQYEKLSPTSPAIKMVYISSSSRNIYEKYHSYLKTNNLILDSRTPKKFNDETGILEDFSEIIEYKDSESQAKAQDPIV